MGSQSPSTPVLHHSSDFSMEATNENKNRVTGDEPAEIARLQEELRREHDMYLRALADFDNYRRRVERDRSTAARSGKRDIVLPLLDILDGFDRALSHIGDQPSSVAQPSKVGLSKLSTNAAMSARPSMSAGGSVLSPVECSVGRSGPASAAPTTAGPARSARRHSVSKRRRSFQPRAARRHWFG